MIAAKKFKTLFCTIEKSILDLRIANLSEKLNELNEAIEKLNVEIGELEDDFESELLKSSEFKNKTTCLICGKEIVLPEESVTIQNPFLTEGEIFGHIDENLCTDCRKLPFDLISEALLEKRKFITIVPLFGFILDLDNDRIYSRLPQTIEELEDRMFRNIGYALWYMNHEHFLHFNVDDPQRIRIYKFLNEFTEERKENRSNLRWWKEKNLIFEEEIENMC